MVEQAGEAVVLLPGEATASNIRHGVRRILAEPTYANRARRTIRRDRRDARITRGRRSPPRLRPPLIFRLTTTSHHDRAPISRRRGQLRGRGSDVPNVLAAGARHNKPRCRSVCPLRSTSLDSRAPVSTRGGVRLRGPYGPRPFELASPLEATRTGRHVHGMLAERGEGNDLQRQLVGRGKHHMRCGSVVVGA